MAVVSSCRSGSGISRETWGNRASHGSSARKHRLAHRRSIAWKDLQSETLLLLNESHCLAQQIGRWCNRHGIRASSELNAFQLSTVLALVAAGQGVSLVPAMAIPPRARVELRFHKTTQFNCVPRAERDPEPGPFLEQSNSDRL